MASVQDLKIIIAEQIIAIYDMRKELNGLKSEITKLRGLKDAGSDNRSTVGDEKTPGLHDQRSPDVTS